MKYFATVGKDRAAFRAYGELSVSSAAFDPDWNGEEGEGGNPVQPSCHATAAASAPTAMAGEFLTLLVIIYVLLMLWRRRTD